MSPVRGLAPKRENRPALAERPSECQLGGDNHDYSTSILRIQILERLYSMAPARAALIGRLHWGELQDA